MPIFDLVTMDEKLANDRWARGFIGSVFTVFAAIALAMAAAGLYGLMADSIGRRTAEFGVRMALGADAGDISGLVVWQGMSRAAIGVAIGVPAAYVAGRALESLLNEVDPADPWLLGVVALFVLGVSGIACWLPARRAAAVALGAAKQLRG